MTTRTPPEHGERRCYLRGCRRPECVQAHIRYMRHYRLIRHRTGARRTDATPIVNHVRALNEQGWSHRQIAVAANCSVREITSLASSTYKTIAADLAKRILNAKPTLHLAPPATYTDSTGTIRRIQALMSIGHPLVAIANDAGLAVVALGRVINHNHERVTVRYAQALEATYQRLQWRPGTSQRARNRAAREGWHGPLAWDGNIDDPHAVPDVDGAEPELKRDQLAELRRTEIEHLAAFGIGEHEIARRLGMATKSVHEILTELRTGTRRNRNQKQEAAA